MYELYPEYSTIHDNYFFAQDERSPAKPPKLTSEEVAEVRNDWFDGLRRLGREKREDDGWRHVCGDGDVDRVEFIDEVVDEVVDEVEDEVVDEVDEVDCMK